MPDVLATWTPEDGLLGALAPLGLAAAAGTALVIDLDPLGPRYPGSRSLADLVATDPSRADLEDGHRGVAVLRNGGVEPEHAAGIVEALCDAWPRVVLRLPPRPPLPVVTVPCVPVRLLVPGGLHPAPADRAVYQATPYPSALPGPGIRLPVPSRRTVAAFLTGRLPVAGDRWVRSWRPVWEGPWTR